MKAAALILALAVLGRPAGAALGEHPQPKVYEVHDPVEAALELAADGQLGAARGQLEKAVAGAPEDAEAWAALAVVYGELKLPREVKRCERRVLAGDRAQGKAILKARREAFKARKDERRKEKEAAGERPLDMQRPQPTPDPSVWTRLEKERAGQRAAQAPGGLKEVQPRLGRKR